jgi:hypothetical protein
MNKFKEQYLPAILAILLWLVSAALGLYCIVMGRDILLLIFSQFSNDTYLAYVLSWVLIIILSLVYIGFIIYTGEYHAKNYGKPGSWRLFIETLGIELLIVLVGSLMGIGR